MFWLIASAGLTHRLATVPLQACTPRRPAVLMTSAEGGLVDAVPQPTNDVLSDDGPAGIFFAPSPYLSRGNHISPNQSQYYHLSLPASLGELIKPREVVISRCYGGYGLSAATVKLLMSRHGLKGEVWDDDDPYYGASLDSELSRHDPRLVEVVKELGPLLSSGKHAYLVIEKTYCDRYLIDDYDGVETLKTPCSLGFKWVQMGQGTATKSHAGCDHPPDNFLRCTHTHRPSDMVCQNCAHCDAIK